MSDTLEKTTELCNSILDLIKLTIYEHISFVNCTKI